MSLVYLQSPVKKIGKHSFTGIIDDYFNPEIEIGNFTSIAPPLYVHGATQHPCVFTPDLVSTFPFGDKWQVNYPKTASKGKIIIGSDVWIGESVTILSGVKIGDGAIIGARSVIANDVLPYAVMVGNPARIIRFRFIPGIIDKLLKIKWWNWPADRIKEAIEDLKDINSFIKKYG